jgi:hypothetical protein
VTLDDPDNGGLDFIFMVNHLNRGNEERRRAQAAGLREWAEDQTLPVVAVGDYNFDFSFRNLTGNQSMAIFFDDESDREAKWHWVIPDAVYSTSGEGGNERALLAATSSIPTGRTTTGAARAPATTGRWRRCSIRRGELSTLHPSLDTPLLVTVFARCPELRWHCTSTRHRVARPDSKTWQTSSKRPRTRSNNAGLVVSSVVS